MTREDELFKRMGQGDDSAVEELIAMYYPEIFRYCIWHAPNRYLAEDAAQETFLKAIRYFDCYVHKGKFRAFLYQIAANTCIDMRRKKWLTEIPFEELPEEPEDKKDGFGSIDEELQFAQIISALPEYLQEIVILRFSQELSMREIAKIVNLPLRTVQSRLRAALRSLRKELENREERQGIEDEKRFE